MAESSPGMAVEKPLVASLCGTFLKAEMQSIYRQVTGLRRHRTIVFTEQVQNAEMFPFDPLVVMTKLKRPRLRGNCILRFWYKHVIKQWPPPRPINKLRKPHYPYNLPALLNQHRPVVAHVYYGHKAVKYLEMLRAWGGPWVVSFHGVDVAKFLDEEGYLEKLHEVFAETRLVLARSQSLLDRLETLGCPPEKLRLNRTPIPLDAIPFRPRAAPENGKWRLIQACRLIPKKGIFTTLKALAAVVKDWPDTVFTLCGTGPIEDDLRERAVALGLERNVEFAGWVDQDALMKKLAAAHLFLHPSELTAAQDQEGIPNSMLEAMATGLPVVATHHGGIPEAMTDGIEGRLVEEKNPAQLADALRGFLSGAEDLAAYSRRSSESVRERFGLDRRIEALEDCYTEAVESHLAANSRARKS